MVSVAVSAVVSHGVFDIAQVRLLCDGEVNLMPGLGSWMTPCSFVNRFIFKKGVSNAQMVV